MVVSRNDLQPLLMIVRRSISSATDDLLFILDILFCIDLLGKRDPHRSRPIFVNLNGLLGNDLLIYWLIRLARFNLSQDRLSLAPV